MPKVVMIMQKFNTPLKAIEYVLSFLIFAATAITGYNSLYGPGEDEIGRGLVTIVGDYKIIPITFAIMATFALADMLAMTFGKNEGLRVREWATFAFTIGFAFESILAFLVLGPAYIVWANNLAVAVISSILYINIKVIQQNEYQR